MPLDPEPSEAGNVHIFEDGERAEVLRREDVEFARAEGRPLYRSHFASCEHADRHRKPQQETLV